MPGRPTPSNASKLRLRFQPLRRHRLWQLLIRYLALGKTGNREQLLRNNGCRPRDSFLSNLGATATCFDYTNVVLRLYKCIGTQRLASVTRNLVVHGASCVTGIDLHITLAPVSSQEPLQLGPRWRGKGGRRE